jgi:hypothetical protein
LAAEVDSVYSVIVLQNSMLAVIAYVIRPLIRALNPGGVPRFWVQTYRLGYFYSLNACLASIGTSDEMEMYILPQSMVFDALIRAGGRPVEVMDDGWNGSR